MSNPISSFIDSAPVEVVEHSPALDDVPENTEEHDLRANATMHAPVVEFLTVPISSGQSYRVAGYDNSRAFFTCNSSAGTTVVSAYDMSGFMQTGASMSAAVPYSVPAIPAAMLQNVHCESKDSIWVYNYGTATDYFSIVISRYAS